MTEYRIQGFSRIAARAVVIIGGIYLAFAVGAPWIINDSPPSVQDVVAAKVCCAKAIAPAEARALRAVK